MAAMLADGRQLILASSSPFRQELLARLQLPFISLSPDVDETPLVDEAGDELAQRLAIAKAQAIAKQHGNALIIGSDQVAVVDKTIVGKPGNHERARMQLERASGQAVMFYTGLCLIDSASGREQSLVEPFRVIFKALAATQIERYLQIEQPYQCAGSFKSEGLGIALFERLQGDDPNALIGLPLIQLIRMLAAEQVDILC